MDPLETPDILEDPGVDGPGIPVGWPFGRLGLQDSDRAHPASKENRATQRISSQRTSMN